jgi:hypothetical protein
VSVATARGLRRAVLTGSIGMERRDCDGVRPLR